MVKCFIEDIYVIVLGGVTTAFEVRIFSHTKLLLTMFTAKVRELFHTH